MLVLNSNMENGTLTVSLRIEPGEFMDALNEAYAEPHGYISCARLCRGPRPARRD